MITISIPGSKSISNRAQLISAFAKNKVRLSNMLECDDTNYMRNALTAIKNNKKRIYCGNAGTAMRFLTAYVATLNRPIILDGSKRMRERPIKDLGSALRALGVKIEYLNKEGYPPLRVTGPLLGGETTISGSISSQYLSGLILAAPMAKKDITINVQGELVSKPYVDMTIQMMEEFGVKVTRKSYRQFHIRAGQTYRERSYTIEPDASSASYFFGLGHLTGTPVRMKKFSPDESIQGDVQFIDAMKLMPKTAKLPFHKALGKIDCVDFPDSAMTLIVMSAFSDGKNEFTGLSNLRVKECDRLYALATELKRIGCHVEEKNDGITVYGNPSKLRGATIKTYNDHRIAMCFGMANVIIPSIKIENPRCVHKTFPAFFKELNAFKRRLSQYNIVLTGMRGSGKSNLGRKLAKALGRSFVDTDLEIEKKVGMQISEIVSKFGWRHFRLLETQTVERVAKQKRLVIATGGGTVIKKKNLKLLKENGRLIFLDCSIAAMKMRLRASAQRPSLTGRNPIDELEDVYRKRLPIYTASADAIVDVSHQTDKLNKDLTQKIDILIQRCAFFGIHP